MWLGFFEGRVVDGERGDVWQLRLMKVRGVRVLPAWIFAIGAKKGLGGPLATPPTCGDAFGRRRVSAAC